VADSVDECVDEDSLDDTDVDSALVVTVARAQRETRARADGAAGSGGSGEDGA
jgi:hypothetical protein